MHVDEGLRLPGPAHDLWLRTRDVVKQGLEAVGGEDVEYRIGGGTILAARWRHRTSFDVDVNLESGVPLRRLDDPRNAWFKRKFGALGGRPHFNPQLNLYSIDFGEQEIELWSHSPLIAAGHRPERVAGRDEVLLSTAQILRGKLERGHAKLSRDVYDVVKAGEFDPRSLEIAANTVPHHLLGNIALDWYAGRAEIAAQARHGLAGAVAPDERVRFRYLGDKGSDTILKARYRRLRVRTDDGGIVVETETESGNRRRMVIRPDEAEREFEAQGVNGHLREKGPGATAVREYAVHLCGQGAGDALVFQEKNDEPTHWRTGTDSLNLPLLASAGPDRAADGPAGTERTKAAWDW